MAKMVLTYASFVDNLSPIETNREKSMKQQKKIKRLTKKVEEAIYNRNYCKASRLLVEIGKCRTKKGQKGRIV